ncbi:MAG TPA: glycoside hydrolase family 3 N-terminal domain-containing protein [Actinomycetaceae bacterium]|nr:glycoside hydrolase family 3 N-terminal domain-containing protein [Actinomycetaceae bacterium]
MPRIVNLKAAPYNLDDDQIKWVEETLAGMSLDQQVGQLFTNLFHFGPDTFSGNPYTAEEIIEKFHIGVARYHGGTAEKVQGLLNRLQSASKIPLLIAANCDSGGNGAMKDGTYIASAAQVEATGSTEVARNAGYVSGREMNAIGANLNFDPCVDILFNWRNTIVNTRAYGTTAEDVIKYSIPFVEGQRESGRLTCVKHWPGDGTEERDQHLILGVNELSVDEWEASFGEVYRAHIANGVEMIMAGHIALPEYQKKLNPELEDKDILPATLADELLNGLLKTELGFNGAVITDATHMLGMTAAMRREDYVPLSIAAGCDSFLFFNNLEEDFGFMKAGVEKGVITKERLDDANRRILGLKAKLRLHEQKEAGTLLRTPEDLEVVGCEEHLAMRADAADKGITLVKNTLDQLPLNPKDHKRIRIYHLTGEVGGIAGGGEAEMLKFYVEELKRRGYEPEVNDGHTRVKGPTLKYREDVDAALVLAEIIGYGAQNNYRIQWKTAMSNEVPWYVYEVPTFMVSHNFTTHLHDATMVKCYINAYHPNEDNVLATLDKMEGKSEFQGTPNDLVWANKWQAKL